MFPPAKVRKVERRTKQILLFFIPRRSTFAAKWQRYGKSGAIQKNLFFFLSRGSPIATNRNRILSFTFTLFSGKPLFKGGSREWGRRARVILPSPILHSPRRRRGQSGR